jgi:RimJ/RimL family protein N-acetyltransferase
VEIDFGEFQVRSFRAADVASLARNANNPNVAVTLRDRFPHPYTEDDARGWIEYVAGQDREIAFAIAVGPEVIGCVGLEFCEDVHVFSAEIGYWLAEPYWGRGIVTRALRAVTEYAFATYDVVRLFAPVFSSNPASARVLEKAGYRREGTLRRSVFKNGEFLDQWIYAILEDELR